jgi:hypothetical protein
MGMISGVPYTVADEEKTNELQPYLAMDWGQLSKLRTAHLEERHGAANVDLVVREGDLARLADSLEGGEVDNTPDATLGLVLLEDGVDLGGVAEVDLVEDGLGGVRAHLVAGDLGAAVHGLGEGVVAVVNDDGEVAPRQKEGEDDMRANVSEAAGDEDALGISEINTVGAP